MHLTGAHQEDAKCFSGKAHCDETINEVVSWLNGVVGEGWQAATQQKGKIAFKVGVHQPEATLPWVLVQNQQVDWAQNVYKVQMAIDHHP